MTELEVLRAARELLSNESRWTQGTCARNRDGYGVDSRSPGACAWCLTGAIRAVSPGEETPTPVALVRLVRIDIPDWNDAPERRHAEVLELLDRAITETEARR